MLPLDKTFVLPLGDFDNRISDCDLRVYFFLLMDYFVYDYDFLFCCWYEDDEFFFDDDFKISRPSVSLSI